MINTIYSKLGLTYIIQYKTGMVGGSLNSRHKRYRTGRRPILSVSQLIIRPYITTIMILVWNTKLIINAYSTQQ